MHSVLCTPHLLDETTFIKEQEPGYSIALIYEQSQAKIYRILYIGMHMLAFYELASAPIAVNSHGISEVSKLEKTPKRYHVRNVLEVSRHIFHL